MTRTFSGVTRTLAFYPVTFTWCTGMGLTAAVVAGVLRLDVATVLFTLVVIAILLSATHHEVGTVHTIVNAQHDEMVRTINRMSARIDQLLHALYRAGVPVPDVEDAREVHDEQR